MNQSPPLPRIPPQGSSYRHPNLPDAGLTPIRTAYFTKKDFAEVDGWRGSSRAGVESLRPTVSKPHTVRSLREANQLPRYPHVKTHSLLCMSSPPPRSLHLVVPQLCALSPKQLHLDVEAPTHVDRIYLQSSRSQISSPSAKHSHSKSDITDDVLKIPSSSPPLSIDLRVREGTSRRLSRSITSDSFESQAGQSSLPFSIPGNSESLRVAVPQVREALSFEGKSSDRPREGSRPTGEVSEGVSEKPSVAVKLTSPRTPTSEVSTLKEMHTPATQIRKALSKRQLVFKDLFQGRKVKRSQSITSGSRRGKNLLDIFLLKLIKGVIADKKEAEGFIKSELRGATLTLITRTHRRKVSADSSIAPKFLLTPPTSTCSPPDPLSSPSSSCSKQKLPSDTPECVSVISQTSRSNSEKALEVQLKPVFTDLTSVVMDLPKEEAVQEPTRSITVMAQAECPKTVRSGYESSLSGAESGTDRNQRRKSRRAAEQVYRKSTHFGGKSPAKTVAEWRADQKLLTAKMAPLQSKTLAAQQATEIESLEVQERPTEDWTEGQKEPASNTSRSRLQEDKLQEGSGSKRKTARSEVSVKELAGSREQKHEEEGKAVAVGAAPDRPLKIEGTGKRQRRSMAASSSSGSALNSEKRRSLVVSPTTKREGANKALSRSPLSKMATLKSDDLVEIASKVDEAAMGESESLVSAEVSVKEPVIEVTPSSPAPSRVKQASRRSSAFLAVGSLKRMELNSARRASLSSSPPTSINAGPLLSIPEITVTKEVQQSDPLNEFIFQFSQSLLVSLQSIAGASEDTSSQRQELVVQEKAKFLSDSNARRASMQNFALSPISTSPSGQSQTFGERLQNLQAKRNMSVSPKELSSVLKLMETGSKLLSPTSSSHEKTPSPKDSDSNKSPKYRNAVPEKRRSSVFKKDLRTRKKKKSDESSESEEESPPQRAAEIQRNFLIENAEFEMKHMAMVKKLAEGIMVGRQPRAPSNVRFFNIALDEAEQKQKEMEDKSPEPKEDDLTPPQPRVESFEVKWQKEAEANDLREDVASVLETIMKGKPATVREFAFSSKVNFDFQNAEELKKERAYRELETAENPDEEGLLSALMRKRFFALRQEQQVKENLIRDQRRVLHMSDSSVMTSGEQMEEFRRQLQKRIHKEKVMRGRTDQEQVRLRAKPQFTFTGLPAESIPRKRLRSTHSEKLLVDGKARLVRDPLELRERVYLRLKGDSDLSKFGHRPKTHTSTSLSSSVRTLTALHSRPGSVL